MLLWYCNSYYIVEQELGNIHAMRYIILKIAHSKVWSIVPFATDIRVAYHTFNLTNWKVRNEPKFRKLPTPFSIVC